MRRLLLLLAVLLALGLAGLACGKKEAQPTYKGPPIDPSSVKIPAPGPGGMPAAPAPKPKG